MPAALLLFLPLLSSLFSSLKNGVKNTAEGKYNKTLGYLLAGLGVYLLVRAYNKSKEQAYLDQAGTDKPTQQAQALKTAFDPYGIGLGTDENLVFEVAAKITDYVAVSDAYRVLYKRELTTDLQDDLSASDLEKFWNIVYKRNQISINSPSGLLGKTVTATQLVNVRKFDDPNYTDHQAKAGDKIGIYKGEATITTNAGKGVYVVVEYTPFFGSATKYFVLKSSVKIA